MKTLRLVIASVIFTMLFSAAAFAQTNTIKIGIINTLSFDAKTGGINKYVNGMNQLNTEFKPDNVKLQNLAKRINDLKKEVQTLQQSKAPIDPKTISAKAEEHDKLVREYKFQEEDAKARYATRRAEVLGPIMQDIGKAMEAYAKQKGYTLLIDISKDNTGLILAIGDEKINVTNDFIAFYNSRPAGTATK